MKIPRGIIRKNLINAYYSKTCIKYRKLWKSYLGFQMSGRQTELFWAVLKKKYGPIMSKFWGWSFHVFKYFWIKKNIVASNLMSCIIVSPNIQRILAQNRHTHLKFPPANLWFEKQLKDLFKTASFFSTNIRTSPILFKPMITEFHTIHLYWTSIKSCTFYHYFARCLP